MDQLEFDGVCAYMAGIWGREISKVQRAAGLKLGAKLPEEAVYKAIDAIANDTTNDRDYMPPWPTVFKAARLIADAEREALPQLPASDALSGTEHTGVMLELRAMETPEQRRRADRMTKETRGIPMSARLVLAGKLLRGDGGAAKLPPATWDALFDDALEAALKEHQPLLPREVRV